MTPVVLNRVCAALGARLRMRVEWQGEALDRLLDAGHAEDTAFRMMFTIPLGR